MSGTRGSESYWFRPKPTHPGARWPCSLRPRARFPSAGFITPVLDAFTLASVKLETDKLRGKGTPIEGICRSDQGARRCIRPWCGPRHSIGSLGLFLPQTEALSRTPVCAEWNRVFELLSAFPGRRVQLVRLEEPSHEQGFQ